MAIYVDTPRMWAGQYHGRDAAQAERVGARNGHKWCHMFADDADCEELHAFAQRIGLRREWFQGDHYDLTPQKRNLAVINGAKPLGDADAVAIWRKQREAQR